MASLKLEDKVTGTITTADGTTVTTVCSFPTPASDASFHLIFRISGKDASGNSVAGFVYASGKRVSGALTVEGTPTVVVTGNAGLVASVPAIGVNGTNFIGTVVGITATNMEWFGRLLVLVN